MENKTEKNRQILIACDHGGLELKTELVTWLEENEYTVKDFGSFGHDIVRYPYYAARVAGEISQGRAHRGILICSTGIGMSMVANKFANVRASVCSEPHTAKMTRLHNDSNVLCLGGKLIGVHMALAILETWLTTPYMGDRHDISLGLIRDIEDAQMTGTYWTGEGNDEYPWR